MIKQLTIDPRVRKFVSADGRKLLDGTLQTLFDEDLGDIADQLCSRAMSPTNCRLGRVLDFYELTPNMELLLRELTWIATVPGWSGRLRRLRAHEALALAGFPENEE